MVAALIQAKVRPMSKLHVLAGKQGQAVEPDDNIWLSASAGTGKTQVLTARVFRLLLRENVNPEDILCLTFTKAGAAEMADRIHGQLAAWVRMPQKDLRQDLHAIGADNGPEAQERARTLFASVLDARGGGLRIMTIHSFCQTLLASFPEEAGIAPLIKPIEERDQKILARQALGEMLVDAEREDRSEITESVQQLSLRLGEEDAEKYLLRCASKSEAIQALPEQILPYVRRLLNLPIEASADEWLARQCSDEVLDLPTLSKFSRALAEAGGKKEKERQEVLQHWLNSEPPERAAYLDQLTRVFATGKGEPFKPTKKLSERLPNYDAIARKMVDWSSELMGMKTLFAYADLLAGALGAGRAFAASYSEAKRRSGVVDFDDLIRMTAKLLGQSDMAEWIRYKLDQRTDHILVDEAQDTNKAQWDIVRALASEFFAGEGAHADRLRTLFTVGDFKQAIFGFQGTSPHRYTDAQKDFFDDAEASERAFRELSLDRSFRTNPPALAIVDDVFRNIGHERLGLSAAVPAHQSNYPDQPGSVVAWKPVARGVASVEGEDEGWIDEEKRVFADKLAKQIKQWLSPENPLWLSRENRPVEPKDIMILVSKRDELSALIVARLFAENIPVAGIDRIRLNQPLVVQDILAAVRFVLQPEDDLNLASLLVSPLLAWTQDELLQFGYRARDSKISLWQHLRGQAELGDRIAPLRSLLGMADLTTPYQFVENILSGPMQGRRKLIARLSHAALDPMEELLNTALAYEGDHVPSLQGFLDWFDRGDVEIKRDSQELENEVRLMTVHGAKGLQAPVVVLANATFNPDNKTNKDLDIEDPIRRDQGLEYPLIRPRKAERYGLLDAHMTIAEERAMEEHWRLLYVAMTRAEEHLIVAGTLGPKDKLLAPEQSWYHAVDQALEDQQCEPLDDPLWGMRKVYTGAIEPPVKSSCDGRKAQVASEAIGLPDWITQPAPVEARPPRPLTPSDLGPDDSVSPPMGATNKAAAERGKLLHSLFQRLPDIAPDKRFEVGDKWLEQQKSIENDTDRKEMLDTVLAVIEKDEWRALFSANGLAEAPIAAVVDEHVISGTVDRLLIGEDDIRVVDFKTGRKVPQEIERAPIAHLRQMAAYTAALRKIFPDKNISAGLLYSHAPVLLEIPEKLLDQHKPGFERP